MRTWASCTWASCTWASRAVAAVLFCAMALPASALDTFASVAEYKALTAGEQETFVGGVYDAYAVLADAQVIEEGPILDLIQRGLSCGAAGTVSDLRRILNDYLDAHPDEHDVAPASLLFFALEEAC